MIYNKIKYLLFFTISALFLFQSSILAKGDGDKNNNGLDKTTTQISRTFLGINNISTQFYNNGISDITQNGNSGLVFPKGSGKTAVFTSGLMWGGLIGANTQPQVGGTAYRTGLQPGIILPDGTADDPTLDVYSIYRVRPDVYPGGPAVDFSQDATIEQNSAAGIRAQYEADWTNWPADLGAPYTDVDSNGTYDPTVDVPGVPGSDQTIWFVANDQDPTTAAYPYGAVSMGIECQVTIWAYAQTGALGNMYFRKYTLINKGYQNNTIHDMYVSMFSDVDLGNAGDDYVGVDTVLSLQYCYNAGPTDQTYNPLPPPATGFDFFQGPLVDGVAGQDRNKNGVDDAIDYGIFKGEVVGPGKINLPMTGAYYFANGDPNIGDPPQGNIQGSTEFYNFFRGRYGISGQPFIDFVTGDVTTYALNGDPTTGTGWLDGMQLSAGDRRQGSASGPFTLAPGDTQEVVVAEIVAGALPGVNNIAAVGLLKYYDGLAQVTYDNFFNLPPNIPRPDVQVVELPNQITLDWGYNLDAVAETEAYDIIFNEENYKFQGYNVYQLPNASATKDEGQLIANFDIRDNFLVIIGKDFDPNTGQIVKAPQQLGNNTGLGHYLEITEDKTTGAPLVNGNRYYFAVTAYAVLQSYDKDVPIDDFPLITNVENPIQILTCVPHTLNPQEMHPAIEGFTDITHTTGLAGGGPQVYVINPYELTGHDYQVYWTTRNEIRNASGDWVPAATILKKSSDLPDSLTGTTIDLSAVYSATPGNLELWFTLNLVSVDDDYADGITLTFPVGTTILSVPTFDAGNGTVASEIVGNVVNMGDITHPYTEDGPFAGGEEWVVNVQASLPISVDWTVYDDGYGGNPLDVSGTTTVTEAGFDTRVAKYWNLLDMNTNNLVLENQDILNGNSLYPPRDDIAANLLANIPTYLQPQVDGFRIGCFGGYASPTTMSTTTPPTLNGAELTYDAGGPEFDDEDDNWRLADFTYFGYDSATASLTLPLYADGSGGTTNPTILIQDYEFRWTGVLADTVINDSTLEYTQSGGSIATCFGASGYNLIDHPFNNTGLEAPFNLRVPFEVWNLDTDEQINVLYWDRSGNPTLDGGKTWNTDNRQYIWLVNTPYDSETVLDPASATVINNATWNIVWYLSQFTTGDIVDIYYDNPIVIGTDTYEFNPGMATFTNMDKAKAEVNDINVYPNPYYGVNSEELNKYNRFVTFTHLPNNATVRIFNLAGVQVRKLDKDADGSQFMRWDLQNEHNLPVASGIYIAYIDLPDLGKTKILKLAIIQEQQILDRF
jgi:hypothetical protein